MSSNTPWSWLRLASLCLALLSCCFASLREAFIVSAKSHVSWPRRPVLLPLALLAASGTTEGGTTASSASSAPAALSTCRMQRVGMLCQASKAMHARERRPHSLQARGLFSTLGWQSHLRRLREIFDVGVAVGGLLRHWLSPSG